MSKIAFIFPGQGSQYQGMGKDICDNFDEARRVFREADDALGLALSRLCFEGPEETLKLTEHTQPAILTVSTAISAVLASRGIRPDYVAGHSLGEYSALAAAGSLALQDAVRVVRNRGKYMQEAVPAGEGAMAAVLGMKPDQVEALCREAAQDGVLAVANLNSPLQIVIAGSARAVQRAVVLAPQRGARRAILLPVSAPFHCSLMRPAEERLKLELAQTSFHNLAIPLVNNADARELTSGHEVVDSLIRQVCAPVKWTASIQHLLDRGVRLFVEVGPSRVLSGLVRQIDRTVKTANVEDRQSLGEAVRLIETISLKAGTAETNS